MTCYALIPAAGGGTRMGAETPKQYLPLAGQPLIWHALKPLASVPAIERVFVVLAPDDVLWNGFDWSETCSTADGVTLRWCDAGGKRDPGLAGDA